MGSVVDKVNKLIALTASSNKHESENAAIKACEIIRDHNQEAGKKGEPKLVVVLETAGVGVDGRRSNANSAGSQPYPGSGVSGGPRPYTDEADFFRRWGAREERREERGGSQEAEERRRRPRRGGQKHLSVNGSSSICGVSVAPFGFYWIGRHPWRKRLPPASRSCTDCARTIWAAYTKAKAAEEREGRP